MRAGLSRKKERKEGIVGVRVRGRGICGRDKKRGRLSEEGEWWKRLTGNVRGRSKKRGEGGETRGR